APAVGQADPGDHVALGHGGPAFVREAGGHGGEIMNSFGGQDTQAGTGPPARKTHPTQSRALPFVDHAAASGGEPTANRAVLRRRARRNRRAIESGELPVSSPCCVAAHCTWADAATIEQRPD